VGLKVPSDPCGSPSGFFAFLDPLQEAPPLDDAHILPDTSQSFDFIMDFEADLDSSFEALGDGPTPVVKVKSSTPPARLVSTRAPTMPVIFEGEEEDGDITITPSEAQRALLPPDRFARPPSASQLAGAVDDPGDTDSDLLATVRPCGEFCLAF